MMGDIRSFPLRSPVVGFCKVDGFVATDGCNRKLSQL